MTTNTATLTENEIMTASQYVQGIQEAIAAKTLFVRGVQIKALHRANVLAICPPFIGPLVKRYMGWSL